MHTKAGARAIEITRNLVGGGVARQGRFEGVIESMCVHSIMFGVHDNGSLESACLCLSRS